MSQAIFLYPTTPANVPDSITQPSASFKKGVSGVMGSIVLFFVVYLLLLMFSIALVVACVYGGIMIISNVVNVLTIILALGLFGVGIMVFVFLVKFMFAVSRYDRSGMVEITEADQPVLFSFIRQLTIDTQTKFPRRIYLSADVNASVFYDSNFWSMFFPVRKNLQIGLGLVNAINITEFKAVMAHEFGHFSQRSMKLGSFVYNVNHVIHNMLFENRSYAGLLQGWASVDGIFAFFATITGKIAQAIQWILRQVFAIINKSYMRLSREMEFHADAVAASVSGSQPLVTALRRVQLANSGYTIALQKCDELFREKKKSGNVYRNQMAVLQQFAVDFKLPLEEGLPLVNDEFLQSNNLARVNFKDQWASHPTMTDREQHLNALAIPAERVKEPAWILFNNREQLEQQLTTKIYEQVPGQAEAVMMNEQAFEEKLHSDIQRFTLPKTYNGFYDNRIVSAAVVEKASQLATTGLKFEDLFSSQHVTLTKKIAAIIDDIAVVKAIGAKQVDAKTFDFDGVKYKSSEAGKVEAQLEKELKEMEGQLEDIDASAIAFFHANAGAGNEVLKQKYHQYATGRKRAEQYLAQVNEMLSSLQVLFSGQNIKVEQINVMIDDLKSQYEPGFKNNLKEWLGDGAFDNEPALKKNAEAFVKSNYRYFTGNTFIDRQLQELSELCNDSWVVINNYLFSQFKEILEKQLETIGNKQ